MSDKKQPMEEMAQETQPAPQVGQELDEKQLEKAVGGMNVAGAVADLVIGGALKKRKKK